MFLPFSRQKPLGLLALLDEESRFPKASDYTLIGNNNNNSNNNNSNNNNINDNNNDNNSNNDNNNNDNNNNNIVLIIPDRLKGNHCQ